MMLAPVKDAVRAQGHVVDGIDDRYVCGRAAMHFTIRQPEAAKLDGRATDHIPWLLAKKASLFKPNGFWDNYRRLLELTIPDDPRKRLDEVTDQILDSLEDPRPERSNGTVGALSWGTCNPEKPATTSA